MDLNFSKEDESFRAEIAAWMADNLTGRFAELRGRGGPGDEHSFHDLRHAWEKYMAASGWTCVGWPKDHGGRGLPIEQQVLFFEEYARAGGPGRVGHIGEGLAGPTISAFGTEAQKKRFLPPIVAGRRTVVPGLLPSPTQGLTSPTFAPRLILRRANGLSTGKKPGPRSRDTLTGVLFSPAQRQVQSFTAAFHISLCR